ncbi:MAG: hypothetical protein ACK58T_34275, partial [Phycisphaerae bacterium]
VLQRDKIERLQPDDYIIALAPPQHIIALDRLFSAPPEQPTAAQRRAGAFHFRGETTMAALCGLYGIDPGDARPTETIDAFLRRRLGGSAEIGDRVPLGDGELLVHALDK